MERNQGQMEDLLQFHRYCYYVVGCPVISDMEYDAMERLCRTKWCVGIASHVVASSDENDYPGYIRDARRPDKVERMERDKRIARLWLEHL
jgi:hypothetical protein